MNNHEDAMIDVAKITPPVGVSTMHFLGVPLSDVVYILTIIYLLVQISASIYKMYIMGKENK